MATRPKTKPNPYPPVRTIVGTTTSTAMFVGCCAQGPFDTPTLIYSFVEFSVAFGPNSGDSEMADQVRMFFINGGTNAYVMRIAAEGDNIEGVSPVFDPAFDRLEHGDTQFNLLLFPKTHARQTDLARAWVYSGASLVADHCSAFLVMDPPDAWKSVQDTADLDLAGCHVEAIRENVTEDQAAVYWPRILVGGRYIGPCGAMAGIMARTDVTRGVWKAPAGLEADIRGIQGLEYPMSNEENALLNERGINAIRAFPSGIVSWGARTMDGYDGSSNEDYKYIPVRRLSLMIEDSLQRGLQFTRHEKSDEELWAQIRLAAGSFMHNLFRQGAFKGERSSQAYFIKIDKETTDEEDVRLGLAYLTVGFAPLKPSDFVTIKILLSTNNKED